ncbi:MAG: diguanylate cyclase [Aeromicrobium sp.]
MGFATEPILSLDVVDGLVELARTLATTSDLQQVLDTVCRALVDVADFESAAINLVTESGDLEVVAVAGPPEASEALLGIVLPRERWDAEIAASVVHHGLLLSREFDEAKDGESWVSDDAAWFARTAGHPQAWLPEYALFVPISDSTGEMVGVVSVDLPRSGLIPDQAQSATVEIVSRQAEAAITAARLLARSELNERVYHLAFDSAPTLTAIAESGGRFVDINRAFRDALPGVADAAEFDRAVSVVGGGPGLCHALERIFEGDSNAATFVAQSGGPGAERWFRVTVRGIGQVVTSAERAVCTIVDITVERSEQLRHRRDAEHDPLTGLLNRRGARAAVDALVAGLASGSLVAVLACDLDGFKAVNDEFGHQVGDDVLVQAAERMRALLPAGALAIRLGGDEFLLVASCASTSEAETLAEGVVGSMRRGVVVDERLVPVTISVGLATARAGEGDSLNGMVDAADRALYESKAAGRSRWSVSSAEIT